MIRHASVLVKTLRTVAVLLGPLLPLGEARATTLRVATVFWRGVTVSP